MLSNTVELADKKHEIDAIANASEVEQAKKSKKAVPYLNAIKRFNALNDTKFDQIFAGDDLT